MNPKDVSKRRFRTQTCGAAFEITSGAFVTSLWLANFRTILPCQLWNQCHGKLACLEGFWGPYRNIPAMAKATKKEAGLRADVAWSPPKKELYGGFLASISLGY